MKTKTILTTLTLTLVFGVSGQKAVNEITFTAINDSSYIQLDSIKIINHTHGGDTVLHWPDTVLSLYQVGLNEINKGGKCLQVFQNYPNPVKDLTTIRIYVPERQNLRLHLTDMLGHNIIESQILLDKGYHTFQFVSGNSQIYFFTALSKEGMGSSSIKIINGNSQQKRLCSLEYQGEDINMPELKSSKATKALFYFYPGDILYFIGYTDTLQSGFVDAPDTNKTYTVQFATNIPCPGTPSINYEGQIYNTVQIFSQCWMKKNLNVGIRIDAPLPQTDNDTIEKYCMGDDPMICDIVGGLYFWDEMMKHNTQTGGQGICPPGWHIPDDLEWQVLEGNVDSQYKTGDSEWNQNNWRGSDAGGNLKQTGNTYWEVPNTGATDKFGFTALPGGYFVQNQFWGPGYKALFYTSEVGLNYFRNIRFDKAQIERGHGGGGLAISVRCIRN
ncbi:MAG: hypothetical protein K8S00_12630 [Bacteroidales bacterium]|nr:hypothetical protein [Bacteroidales bacterium]